MSERTSPAQTGRAKTQCAHKKRVSPGCPEASFRKAWKKQTIADVIQYIMLFLELISLNTLSLMTLARRPRFRGPSNPKPWRVEVEEKEEEKKQVCARCAIMHASCTCPPASSFQCLRVRVRGCVCVCVSVCVCVRVKIDIRRLEDVQCMIEQEYHHGRARWRAGSVSELHAESVHQGARRRRSEHFRCDIIPSLLQNALKDNVPRPAFCRFSGCQCSELLCSVVCVSSLADFVLYSNDALS